MESRAALADALLSANAALPIVASSILDRETEQRRAAELLGPWKTGIKSLDASLPEDLWTGGKVVGVQDAEKLTYRILLQPFICSDQRLATRETSSSLPSAYIIHSHSSSPVRHLQELMHERDHEAHFDTSSPGITAMLERISILEYFDFAGLAECVAEVSASLHHAAMNPNAAHESLDGVEGRLPPPPPPSSPAPTVLVIDGLQPTVSQIDRRSGHVQTCALLSSLLRTLTHLSRTHASWLLLLLRLEPSSPSPSPSTFPAMQPPPRRLQDPLFDSAFSSLSNPLKNPTLFAPNGPATTSSITGSGSAVGKTLAAGLDVLVIVHEKMDPDIPRDAGDADTDRAGRSRTTSWRKTARSSKAAAAAAVVEVVADRVEMGKGAWGVWVGYGAGGSR